MTLNTDNMCVAVYTRNSITLYMAASTLNGIFVFNKNLMFLTIFFYKHKK